MILHGDCREKLKELSNNSVNCCVTSPPYFGLRDYGVENQIGLEQSPEEYVENLVQVFSEVKRVLKDDGTLWLNLGDSYWANRSHNGLSYINDHEYKHGSNARRAGGKSHEYLKPKDLIGIPWLTAFALQKDGWYLRNCIIWNKPSCMPESVTDRVANSHEYIFLLSKSRKYYFDHESIKEPTAISTVARFKQDISKQNGSDRANGGVHNGTMKAVGDPSTRNKRSVWTVSTANFSEAHFATFPPKLIEPCILAGSSVGGTVLDPFNGSGTTGLVSIQNGREYIGIELNPEYIEITERRLSHIQPVINF